MGRPNPISGYALVRHHGQAQRDEIRAWAKRQGVEVVSWHEDRLSGATPAEKREGFLSALADLKQLEAGVLVAAKRDRLARDVVVAATIERLVQDAGSRIVTADGVSAAGLASRFGGTHPFPRC